MFNNSKIAKSIQLALAFGVASAGFVAPASAQEDDSAEAVEKISVTGSRIRSASLTSPSPLQIIDSSAIDASGSLNLQDLLLENPTFGSPAISRTNSNFNTSSAGVATIDLRNLGRNRTLTLVNGRRYVAGIPGESAVDLNTIPAQFVERVEILTGGASSVYGSDAVAGVVNFILKDSFEGLEFESQYGETKEGDGQERQFSLTGGASSADDRGHLMFHLSYTDQGAIFSRDRERSAVDQISEVFFTGDINDVFSPVRPFFSSFPPQGRFDTGGQRFTFDSAGNLQNGFSTNGDGTIGPDGFNRSGQRTIAIPTERYLFAANGDYELNDKHSVFFEATYASTQTVSELEPFPFASDDIFADGLVPIEFDVNGTRLVNPFVPDEILNVANDGNGDGFNDFFFARRLSDIGNRGNRADRNTFRFSVGLEGELFNSWNYDVYYVYGQNSEAQVGNGLVNVQNFRFALEAATDTLDLDGDGITNEVICLDATARSFGCVPINVFGENSISPEAAAYVTAPSALITAATQEIYGGNLSGDLFELPAGPVGLAVGFEYREETSRTEFDALQQAGLNAGNAIPPTFGDFDVTEFYAEINVPIIEGLNFRGAARTSDYSTVGNTFSYNYGFEYQITEWIKIRAIEAQSTRAPNVDELFSPLTQTFPTGLVDPCIGVGATGGGAAGDRCRLDAGVLANIAANGVFTLNQSDVQGISGFNGGNPNLFEEEGTSTTIGVVFTPESLGIPVLSDFSITLDYFDIEIEDAIVPTPRQFILDQCFGDGDIGLCDFITRRQAAAGNNSAGSLEFIDSFDTNSGGFNTEGIDFTVLYGSEIYSGQFNARLAYTHVIGGDTVPLPGAESNPFAGEVGASEDRFNLNLGYNINDWNFNLSTTFIGEAALDDQFLSSFGFEPESVEVNAEIYLDFQTSYQINDTFEVYGGVDNLLDNDPPAIITGLPGNDTGTETDAGTYDAIGQRWYIGFRAKL